MIDHVLIYVRNLSESKQFYEKAFVAFGYGIAFGEKEKMVRQDAEGPGRQAAKGGPRPGMGPLALAVLN